MSIPRQTRYFFFLIFVILNVSLYLFIFFFHAAIPFSKHQYIYNAHHYLKDPRIENKPFQFLRALGQYDAQWYLKIADTGYPVHPQITSNNKKEVMDGLTYNFFPLLPLLIGFSNLFFQNVELAAFFVANLFLTLNFFSLYYIISRLYSEKLALKTIFLLFLFPMSIFFRSYYTESIRLFLLLWFSYFLIRKRFFLAAGSLGLLSITNGISLLLYPVFFFYFIKEILHRKKIQIQDMVTGIISFVPICLWMLFCLYQTGNLFYFYFTRFSWIRPEFPLLHNIFLISIFPWLPTYSVYGSKLDVAAIIVSAFLLFAARKFLSKILWIITAIVFITPLLMQDTISSLRFQIVLFPLFMYLAHKVKGVFYVILLICFGFSLFLLSLLFVNWYWIE